MKDIKDIKTPINALPEYKIRTMKDDLAKVAPKKAAPPEKLPIAPLKVPLPSTEELIRKEPAPTLRGEPEIPKPPQPVKIKPEIPKLPRPKPKPKLLVILLIILLILFGIGLFFYWQGEKQLPPPLPSIDQVEEPEASESLIPVDEAKIASLSAQLNLFELLKQEAELDQITGTFKRIAILKNEKEFLSLTDFLQELEIVIPPYALAELKETYTLVLYSQNGKRHLGLIAEVKNSDNLKEQLNFWEETMVDDLANFFLGVPRGEPATLEFQDNVYKETAIRYINFPEPDLTIDYAIINDVFILTTSRESIYKIIDKVKE